MKLILLVALMAIPINALADQPFDKRQIAKDVRAYSDQVSSAANAKPNATPIDRQRAANSQQESEE